MYPTRPYPYRTFFNHDGFCVYSNASRYQSIDEPVGLAQVHGYVDEIAAAGIDVVALCPNMYQIPGWDAEHYPYWRAEGPAWQYPDTAVGHVLSRCRDFILSGHDLIRLTMDRARQRDLTFFLTWRMNESHGVNDPDNPGNSKFWRDHPEFRIGGSGPNAGWVEAGALSFAHPEVRDYQFGFLDELCRRYEIDGLELDFLRFPNFFPRSLDAGEKARIMTGFVQRVRNLLDSRRPGLPLCVRVHNRLQMVHEAGLDLETWVRDGLVQMVNVSPDYIMQHESEIEGFRAALSGAHIFGELTQCMTWGKPIELSVEQSRKSTPEVLWALAHSFLERGADGISFFNFTYYRDYSFGNPAKLDRFEPPYAALAGIADADRLARRDKHYYIGSNGGWTGRQLQLPRQLGSGAQEDLRIHVADAAPVRDFRRGVFRLMSERDPIESLPIQVTCDSRKLVDTMHSGELFPTHYLEGIPKTHAPYRDFTIPLEALHRGWNTFTASLAGGNPIQIDRAELALYR